MKLTLTFILLYGFSFSVYAVFEVTDEPMFKEAGFFSARDRRKEQVVQKVTVHYTKGYGEVVSRYAVLHNLDEKLIHAIIKIESNYKEKAKSNKGAMGLMQVMPFHFKSGDDPFSPEDNIRVGTAFLAELRDYFGSDVDSILAAYNAGLSTVVKYGGIPPYKETINYVKKVQALL